GGLGPVPPGTTQTLTAPDVTFTRIQRLLGGQGNDTFVEVLQKPAGTQPLAAFDGAVQQVDGGQGTNQLQTQLVLAGGAPVQPADNLLWGVTTTNAGWQSDPNAAPLLTPPIIFDQKAVGLDQKSLTLAGHGLSTGQ